MFASFMMLWAAAGAGTFMLSLWLRPYIAPSAGLEWRQAPSTDSIEDYQIRHAEFRARNPLKLIWKVRLGSVGTPMFKALLLVARAGTVLFFGGFLLLLILELLKGSS